jgi:divalent metal cation (Fe/Co/Zn/Cd) transporter
MTIADRVKGLRKKWSAPAAQDTLSVAMDADAFDHRAARMRRDMFLSGGCLGSALTGLFALHAYGTLAVLIAAGVVWIAWHGWPWER